MRMRGRFQIEGLGPLAPVTEFRMRRAGVDFRLRGYDHLPREFEVLRPIAPVVDFRMRREGDKFQI